MKMLMEAHFHHLHSVVLPVVLCGAFWGEESCPESVPVFEQHVIMDHYISLPFPKLSLVSCFKDIIIRWPDWGQEETTNLVSLLLVPDQLRLWQKKHWVSSTEGIFYSSWMVRKVAHFKSDFGNLWYLKNTTQKMYLCIYIDA